LHEPAGQEQALAVLVPAVAVAQLRRLAGQLERRPRGLGGEERHRPFAVALHRLGGGGAGRGAAPVGQRPPQAPATPNAAAAPPGAGASPPAVKWSAVGSPSMRNGAGAARRTPPFCPGVVYGPSVTGSGRDTAAGTPPFPGRRYATWAPT